LATAWKEDVGLQGKTQPEEFQLENDTYIQYFRDYGKETSPAFLVSI